jgi:hypothetical protein
MPQEKEKKETSASDQTVRPRPMWQRLVYPLFGMVLSILGVILWLTPVVPGWPLFFIGVPLMFCFHPRLELWGHKKIHAIGQSLKARFKRK